MPPGAGAGSSARAAERQRMPKTARAAIVGRRRTLVTPWKGTQYHVLCTEYAARLLPHLFEVVRSLLVRGNNVEQPVAVHVDDLELRADAAVVVDLVRRPNGLA